MSEHPDNVRVTLTALNLPRNCAPLKIEVQLVDPFAALIYVTSGSIGVAEVEIYVFFSQRDFLRQLGIFSPLISACSVLRPICNQ